MTKRQRMDPHAPLLNTDETSMVLSFVNDHKTVNNFAMCNKAMHSQLNFIMNDLLSNSSQKLIDFWRGKAIDPLLAFVYLKEIDSGIKLPSYASDLLNANKIHVELSYKALNRCPGGNVDSFILLWRLIFTSEGVKVWRCKSHNWDGSYYATNPFWCSKRNNWPHLLKCLMKQTIRKKHVTFTKYYKYFDSDEYDTEFWSSHIRLFVNNQETYVCEKVIVTKEEENTNPLQNKKPQKKKSKAEETKGSCIDYSSPDTLFGQLQEFCQVKLPVNESRDFEGEYGKITKSGIEMRNQKSTSLDEDDSDCDDDYHSIYANHLQNIIDRISKIEPVEPIIKQSKVDEDDGEDEEQDEEQDDEQDDEQDED